MTREMGKVLDETRGDVQEGIDTAYYAATEGRRLFGHTVPSELRDKWAMSFRRPIGVCGLITPFNFPLAIPTWKMFPALALRERVHLQAGRGRAAHRRRARRDPARGGAAARGHPARPRLRRGGRRGDRRAPRDPRHLLHRLDRDRARSSARPAAGCTSGSRSRWAARTRRSSCDDADMDLALDGVLWGAFGTTGQRCTATSRLLLQDGIHDEFLDRLVERTQELKLGDGRKTGTDVGPLINQQALDEGRALHRDRAGRRAPRSSSAASARAGKGLDERLLLRADDLRRRRAGQPARAGGDLRARSSA